MDPIKRERIDLLYKNLEYNSQAYTAAESGFPSWEAAYALIVGQLFIAYFQMQQVTLQLTLSVPIINLRSIDPHNFIAFFGLLLSGFWFILVSLNLQTAASHMYRQLHESHSLLRQELGCTPANIQFIEIYPNDIDKKNWKISDILWGNKPGESRSLRKMLKSTWFYRRALPFILFLVWGFLLLFCDISISSNQ